MKNFLALLALTVFLGLMAGCSSDSSGGSDMPADAPPKAGSTDDPAKSGNASQSGASPALPPPPISGGK